ncbi:MAG: HRDC domain-containing protein [Actinobacteria bacterium]|nr:HRDC domain-containing protein [Actinomycetota bacterium]
MTIDATTRITWVDTEAAFGEVLEQLTGASVVALDTEFHRERTYFPKLALVQLAFEPGSLVLVDPLAVSVEPLGAILESDATIVIHASSQDLEVLRLATGTVPRNMFDTQIAAGFIGYSTPSLATLHESLLGVRLDKGDRLTDWLVRPLAGSVLDYAAGDVRYLLTIHDHLVSILRERDRLDWALEECAIALARGAEIRDPDDAWRRVKGAGKLGGRAALVARRVAAWREDRAAQLDIPVRHVLGDMALVSIAQRPPKNTAELAKVRGIDGRALKGEAAAGLLAAIERGRSEPIPAREPSRSHRPDEQQRAASALLASWLTQHAHELQIDSQLLATRSDIEHFVQGTGRGRLGEGWRRDLAGAAMQDLLEGRSALAFDRARGIVLEPRTGQPAPTGDASTMTA